MTYLPAFVTHTDPPGERKRVSLGREMVNDPPLILLDEPTTGLDSKMASVVVAILSRWARRGKTIVLSIHQVSLQLSHCMGPCLSRPASGWPPYLTLAADCSLLDSVLADRLAHLPCLGLTVW